MTTASPRATLPSLAEAWRSIIQSRPPRAAAKASIALAAIPMRTCYETMTRLVGPVGPVLDYASFLFTEEEAAPTHPTPALALEEAHLSDDGTILTLVLVRGSYTAR